MTISPNISALLNLLAALVAVVVGASAEWTTLFGSGPSATIIADATIVATVLTGINTFLHQRLGADSRCVGSSAALTWKSGCCL